jgi:hypothetical protein
LPAAATWKKRSLTVEIEGSEVISLEIGREKLIRRIHRECNSAELLSTVFQTSAQLLATFAGSDRMDNLLKVHGCPKFRF